MPVPVALGEPSLGALEAASADHRAATAADRVRKLDEGDGLPLTVHLHVLGVTGFTAYGGMLRIARVQPDDKVPIRRALHEATPDGIDVYFDNVGGDHLDAALARMHTLGRIAVCGMISGYNEPGARAVVRNLANVIYGRITLRRFTVADIADLWSQFVDDMTGWLRAGRVTYRETVLDGMDAAPGALIGLFEGRTPGRCW